MGETKSVDKCGKPSRKRTSIWTEYMDEQRLGASEALVSAGLPRQRWQKTHGNGAAGARTRDDRRFTRDELYSIPAELRNEIADCASRRVI